MIRMVEVDGREVPGGLEPQETPQMIMLTFDDAVNNNNWGETDTILSPGTQTATTELAEEKISNIRTVRVFGKEKTMSSSMSKVRIQF